MTARVGDWLKTQWQSNRGWLIALTVVVVLGLLGWGWVWSGGDDQVTRMDRLTGFAQLIGGSALLLGLVFTWRTVRNSENTFQQTRRSQDSDRFFKAVEQLGSGTADVRCGAIYSIRALIKHSDDYYQPGMDVLMQFIRRRSRVYNPFDDEVSSREDIQAAIDVVIRRSERSDDGRRTPLSFAGLPLQGFDFSHGWLDECDFNKSQLVRAKFRYASLRKADFREAICGYTNFEGADLRNADLSESTLDHARFFDPSDGATTRYTANNEQLQEIREIAVGEGGVHPTSLPPWGTRLQGTLFLNLKSLKNARLSWVNLSGTIGLREDDLASASLGPRPELPKSVMPPSTRSAPTIS